MVRKIRQSFKKFIAVVISMLMVISSVPLTALAADITNINSSAEFGVIEGSRKKTGHQLHYAKYDGKTYITFCTQFGVDSPVGRVYDKKEFSAFKNKNDETFREIAKYIYFGYTMVHGDGLPSTPAEYKDACATQQFVWETLGVNPTRSSWDSSYMSNDIYNNWKSKTDKEISLYYDTHVSFHNKTINVNYKSTETITDTNGALQYYPTFERNINDVVFKHEKGSNDLKVTATSFCNSHNISFKSLDFDIEKGMSNGEQYNPDINSFISFEFVSGNVQNLMFSRYVDPDRFNVNINVEWGSAEITKELGTSQTAGRYGDVRIAEAEYTLYAKENITSNDGKDIIYKKDTEVASGKITANTDGKTGTLKFDKLPYGKYYIKETKSPTGTQLDKTVYDVNVSSSTENVKSTNEVNRIKVKLFKEGNDGTAGKVIGVKDAEFTIKLLSDYNTALEKGYTYEQIWAYKNSEGNWIGLNEKGAKVENVDQTKAKEANEIAPTYSKVVTDEDGVAVTDYLPYGSYITKETITPKNFASGNDFTFEVTKDESEYPVENKVLYFVINNTPYKAPVKIVKEDKDSGKTVTYSSTKFKIRALEDIKNTSTGEVIYKAGDFVQYEVGNNNYNEFMTNSDGFVTPTKDSLYATTNDEKGTVTTPFKLPAGKYEVVETESPEHFLDGETDKTYPFEITSEQTYEYNEDGTKTVKVTVQNEQPKGKIEIKKNLVLRDNVDTSLIDKDNIDYTKIGFELTAAKDIIDYADGEVIYKADQKIGEYYLNENGTLTIENLWMGDYAVKEISTVDGFVLDNAVYVASLTQNDKTTKIYTKTFDIDNYTTEVDLSKVEIGGSEELEGAEIAVTDKDGNVLDEWTSTNEKHIIEGLKVGETYIMTEKTAPYGYECAESIEFTVGNKKDAQTVVMEDKPILSTVKVNKVDSVTKENIKSEKFEFTIYSDEKCENKIKTVNANTKDGTALFTDLRYGEYFIKETKAPKGYELSDEVVKITINDKGVFANDKELTKENDVYSFEYVNSLLPSVYTGDSNAKRTLMYITMVAIAVIFIIAMIIVRKKTKK